jgi:hypothetical protein
VPCRKNDSLANAKIFIPNRPELCSRPFPTQSIPILVLLESRKILSLCRTGSLEALDSCGSGRALHITFLLCTGLSPCPVRVVGKQVPNPPPSVLLSKCPELHSRVLENWTHTYPSLSKPFRLYFHFSFRYYGYYCSFTYPSYTNRTRRPSASALNQPKFAAAAAPSPALNATPHSKVPGIQRSTPVFHPHACAKVNTIKNKKRQCLPRGGNVLYSVASTENTSIGPS